MRSTINIDMKIILTALLLTTLFFQTSCATALRSTKEPLTVRTNVHNAKVAITANVPYRTDLTTALTEGFYYVGTAPMTFDLPRNGIYDVVVSKEGYEQNSAVVTPKLGPTGVLFSAGNIIFGGVGLLVGGAVDVTSGAIYQHSTRNLYLPLEVSTK